MQVEHKKYHSIPGNDSCEVLGIYVRSLSDFFKQALQPNHELTMHDSEIEYDIQGDGEWVEAWKII